MFEVLTRIIQIVVDIVGKYVNLRAHPSAPLRMFELYISLRDVVQEGKDMIRDFRSYPLQIDSLKSKLNMQSEKLQKFGSLLFNVSYELEIFDPQGLRDIETALGFKYYALFKYFYIITYVEGGSLVVNKTTKLPAIAREFEKRFDLRPDDLKQMAFIDSQTFDLTDRIQVEQLCNEADGHLALLEEALANLGKFIRENCKIDDLFPRSKVDPFVKTVFSKS